MIKTWKFDTERHLQGKQEWRTEQKSRQSWGWGANNPGRGDGRPWGTEARWCAPQAAQEPSTTANPGNSGLYLHWWEIYALITMFYYYTLLQNNQLLMLNNHFVIHIHQAINVLLNNLKSCMFVLLNIA